MDKITLNWMCQSFNELSNKYLYEIMRLRSEVFIIEQHCIYLDADRKDFQSYHLMAWDQENLVAYTRLLPKNIAFAEASIGRVITSPKYRAIGAGKELMHRSIQEIYQRFGKQPIRIGAQLYLKQFYESFGFVACGKEYLEDNIPHMEMLKA